MTIHTSIEDGIGRIVLDEAPLNILSQKLLGEVRDALAKLGEEQSLRVLVISAEGKHFSAGADVGEHMPPAFEQMIPEFIETVAAIDAFPLPVIAAVKGRCLGGGFVLFGPLDAFPRQTDLSLVRVDAKDLHLDVIAHFDDFFGVLHLVVGQFGNVE